ncbi:hypothetical protein RHMOL_Rhmol10G0026900 [Rhododendron molle]|uniref:Uncharacterized protein n=1 Tax=Rhododendron molle TaxID=49168 RepID=A0ACC0LY83_RHOML|nr:hypothetical protein RHMOL_Rhmol10G0026900 [Rhododendron molle]
MAIVLFSFVAVLVAPLLHLPKVGCETDVVVLQKTCGHNQARDGLKYMANYFNVTKTMHGEMRKKRFALRKGGEYPDQIYVLSQCMNDLSGDACDACFSRGSSMLSNCLAFTSGQILLGECFMRFDNYNFFRETASTSIDKPQRAPRNRGYARGKKKTFKDDDSPVLGVASCLKTMDTRSCATCLANASAAVAQCLPSEEGIAYSAGCGVRYFHPPSANKNNFIMYAKYALGAAAFSSIVFLIGIVVGNLIYKKRKNHQLETQGLEINSLITISMRFKYSTLQKATDDFSVSHKIGRGGYGEVFKGALQDGREIAIKRLFISGRSQTNTVCNEMDIICLAQHENLVRFLGSCFENDSLLVYEFVANGSLDRTLFGMLVTTGYMAPEYLSHGRLTEKVDVYSYGVLVLEIISGVENNNYHSEDILSTLVTTTWKHFQAKTAGEIIDTSIAIEDVKGVERIIQIGLLCTQESPSLRPDMGDVVQWLERKNLQLPSPSKPPFADECLTILPDSPLVSFSFRPHEHSISIDSCKYYDVDNNNINNER